MLGTPPKHPDPLFPRTNLYALGTDTMMVLMANDWSTPTTSPSTGLKLDPTILLALVTRGKEFHVAVTKASGVCYGEP